MALVFFSLALAHRVGQIQGRGAVGLRFGGENLEILISNGVVPRFHEGTVFVLDCREDPGVLSDNDKILKAIATEVEESRPAHIIPVLAAPIHVGRPICWPGKTMFSGDFLCAEESAVSLLLRYESQVNLSSRG